MRAIVTAVVLTGCAAEPPAQIYRGEWQYGFEYNQFREPGREYAQGAGWCLEPASPEVGRALVRPVLLDGVIPLTMTPHRLRVVVEGQLGPRREHGYGHMGQCEREVDVTRVVSAELIERGH